MTNSYFEKEIEFLSNFSKDEEKVEICRNYCDRELDILVDKYRKRYLEKIQSTTNYIWKSPEINKEINLDGNNKIKFSYERNMQLTYLETSIEKDKLLKTSYQTNAIVTSSGMSSIYLILMTISSIYSGNINCYRFSDYFETRMLSKVLGNTNIVYKNVNDLYTDNLNELNIIYIEPVSYTWEFPVFDFNKLTKFIKNIDKHFVIIVDSTLIGDLSDYTNIIDKLNNESNVFLFEVRSLLKMDQYGMEFTNGGLIQCFHNESNNLFNSKEIARYMKELRIILGYGLNSDSYHILSDEFIRKNLIFNKYKNIILENNLEFHQKITSNKLFRKINYPEYPMRAPFIIFELEEPSKTNYLFLISIISHFSEKHKLSLYYGSSFGFRHHRYEIIIPNESNENIIFKLAMGYRKDYSYYKILELLNDLSLHTMEELVSIYKGISTLDLDI